MKKIVMCLMVLACLLAVPACKQNASPKDDSGTSQSGDSKKDKHDSSKDIEGSGLTQIRIVSETGKNDFVTEPIAHHVKEASKQWLNADDPLLFKPDPYYEKCKISVYDKDGKYLLDAVSGKVKVRGNYSSSYDKKPLRIKFDEKQSMSNMHGGKDYKNWVLLAEFKDFSLLRNVTALKLAELVDEKYYNSDYELAEVYINDKYWGIYLIAEQQEPKKTKVKLTEGTSNEIGYFIEYDSYAYTEDFSFDIDYKYPLIDYYGNEVLKGSSSYSFKSDVTEEQTCFISDYMNNLWELCYQAAYNNYFLKFNDEYGLVEAEEGEFADAKACISAVVDLDSLVGTYVQQEIVCDPDFYCNSVYMDIDLSKENPKKLTFEAAWDFDSALGNKRQCQDAKGVWAGAACPDVNFYPVNESNPWLMVFVNCDWFQQLISEKWNELQKANVLKTLLDQIDYYTTNNEANFKKNSERWVIEDPIVTFGNELNEVTRDFKTQKEAAAYLKEWLTKRFAALDDIWGKVDSDFYRVVLDYNDGSEPLIQNIKKGGKITKPADPTRENCDFLGWYCGDVEYKFDNPVINLTKIYAKWRVTEATSEQGRLNVKFEEKDGQKGFEVTIKKYDDDPEWDPGNCFIMIPEINLRFDFENQPDHDTDGEGKEIPHVKKDKEKPKQGETSRVFIPFAEKDLDYTFIYIHDEENWTEEIVCVTCLDDGLNMHDYVDFDLFDSSIVLTPSDTEYSVVAEGDVSKYLNVGEDLINLHVDLTMVIGNQNWNPGYWIRKSSISIDGEDYQDLLNPEKGYKFTNWEDWQLENLKNEDCVHAVDTWFVGYNITFQVKDMPDTMFIITLDNTELKLGKNCKIMPE